ncbi:MAG: beta-hydroxyacyl-ACP dehydratase, partial [Planctomycetota bacterium]
MRWMWIDTIVTYEPDKRLVAIKNVSLAEEHLHDHFPATATLPAQPVMPASLMIEGMAQTAGILVGSLRRFKEKVVLAKIQRAEINADVIPGQCIRYD